MVFATIPPLPVRASGLKPDADGELWNAKYTVIDANFVILEGGAPGEFWAAGGGWSVPVGTGITNGHVIQDEGTPVTQRANMDFIGDLVVATNGVSATEVNINLQNDLTPQLGGDLDGNGNVVFLSNDTAYQIKDSGGTVRNVILLDNSDDIYLAFVDLSVNGDAYLQAGDDLIFRTSGNLGSWTDALLLAGSLATFYGNILLENNNSLRWEDSVGGSNFCAYIDLNDNFNLGHIATGWGEDVRIYAGDSIELQVAGATTRFIGMGLNSNGSNVLWSKTPPITEPDRTLSFFRRANVNAVVPAANFATMFSRDVSTVAEMFAVDEAGNETQLTPHPGGFLDATDENIPAGVIPWAYESSNAFIGKKVSVNMTELVLAVEELTGKTFIHVEDLPENQKLDWDDVQTARKAQRDQERDKWESKKSKLESRIAIEADDGDPETLAVLQNELESIEEKPEDYKIKSKPAWIAKRTN